MLIVDEAFADFDGQSESLAPSLPASRAVVLRSFGKAYGLAGLRLGFALASPDIVPSLRAALGPWPVSGPAIAIGVRALADSDWLEAMRGAPRPRSRAARRSPARRWLANHRRNVASFDWPRMPMHAPPLNGSWPQESSPALSQTLQTACDSGFRATRTRGNGSPRRCEGKLNRCSSRLLAFPHAPHKRRAWPIARREFSRFLSGAPFLPTLSRALLDGVLIDGFPGAGGPMALADATIYVPTQRAAQALAKALLSASGGQSLLLPRIAPLGAFEPDETAAIFDPEGEELPRAAVPPAVGALTRRHALATLTRAWGKALRGAIRQADADGRLIVDPAEPALVAATPAQAYALAGDLAALIDDMIIEGAPWTRLETLAPDLYDPYWRITLDFLKIAFAHWPEWLAERGLIDRAKRIALLIEDEIKALEGSRRGPTIIAGSTGANRATARLIAAIASRASGRGRAARPRPQSRRSLMGDDRRQRGRLARARGPSAGAAASADWRDRRQARGRHASWRALACA